MEEPMVNVPGASQRIQTGKSVNSSKMWTIIFAALSMVAVGFAAWQTAQSISQSSKVGGLEATINELRESNTKLQAENSELKGVYPDTDIAVADRAKILAVVDAYIRAPVTASGKFEYAIQKTSDKFSRVNVKLPEEGSLLVWLKKVDENWTVLSSGQDIPGQDTINKYGLPSEMIE